MDYFLKRNVLNLFFPNRCPICNEIINTNDRFCPECTEKISLYNGNFNIDGATEFYASIVYSKAIMPALFMLKSGECGNSDYQKGQRRDIFCDEPPEVFIERPKAEAESRRDYADSEKEIYHFLLCVCETRFHTQLVV